MMLDADATPSRVRRAMPAIIEKAQALYVRRCPDLSEKICPGARVLLARLQRRGIPLALVTGNLTRIGWRKMERCGLKSYFRFGAFAEMARDRAGLARIAIRHARRQGWIGKQGRHYADRRRASDILPPGRIGRGPSPCGRAFPLWRSSSCMIPISLSRLSAVRIKMLL